MNFLDEDKKGIVDCVIIFLFLIIIGLLLVVVYKVFRIKDNREECIIPEVETVEECEHVILEEKVEDDSFYIDIKGAVNNPGVYLVNSKQIVNDAIELAGGLDNGAYTKNINLSKKLTKEMVIIIYRQWELKNEVKEEKECVCDKVDISACVDNNANIVVPEGENNSSNDSNVKDEEEKREDNDKININTALVEELVKLTGIGEAKAKAIVEYRNTNGLFSSTEDIKKVTGISDSIYEKIKDSITV